MPPSSFAEPGQGRLARLFGITPKDRENTVAGMLARGQRLPAGYWLQLLLAMGIATLGLLLGSTAVVIGAMLVSPLMQPIIQLGMGLAIGSPLLVVRTALRVSLSVVVVIASAALLTLLVPIHEVTSEIAARTTPNLLDLAIASFCALAGVYAAIRADADTASTAAGTAIGIALVPPLCVVGFGFGTRTVSIAAGAGLLFTANFCAILFFSVLGFVLLGYGRVPVAALEIAQRDADEPGFVRRAARRLSAFFSSKLGPAVRVAMPLLFVAAVFVPLRSALREVTWEVRARKAARDALEDLAADTLDVRVRVEQHRVYIRLIVVKDGATSAALRSRLVERVRAATNVTPDVEVVSVPDAEALARAEASLRETIPQGTPAAAPSAATTTPPLEGARVEVESALGSWPTDAAGSLAAWKLTMPRHGSLRLEVVHIGEPLGRAATGLLGSDLSRRLGETVIVNDIALPAERVTGDVARIRVRDVPSLLRGFPEASELHACVVVPRDEMPRLTAEGDARIVLREGSTFELRWSPAGCEETATDAGADAQVDAGH